MNKKYLGIVLLILATVVVVYFGIRKPATEPIVDETINSIISAVNNSGDVGVVATSSYIIDSKEPTDIELDLSKLQGKDRLYTEEEGKYENLSEEERKLLIKSRCIVHQQRNQEQHQRFPERRRACNERTSEAQADRLISLSNSIAVIYGPSGAEMKGWVYIYNANTGNLIEDVDTGNYAFGPNYIIRRGENYIDQTKKFDGWILELYRPGMDDFVTIPNSRIELNLSYLENVNFFARNLTAEFYGDNITVYMHHYEYNNDGPIDEFTGLPIQYKLISKIPQVFNLSNLP